MTNHLHNMNPCTWKDGLNIVTEPGCSAFPRYSQKQVKQHTGWGTIAGNMYHFSCHIYKSCHRGKSTMLEIDTLTHCDMGMQTSIIDHTDIGLGVGLLPNQHQTITWACDCECWFIITEILKNIGTEYHIISENAIHFNSLALGGFEWNFTEVIFDVAIVTNSLGTISLVKLPSGDCYWTSLVQHWFR